MRIHNVHERLVQASSAEVGSLLDSISGPDDQLWPSDRWPALRLDQPLRVGASGGHAFVRYEVARYEPGRRVVFRFAPSFGVEGEHRLEVEAVDEHTTRLRHVLDGRAGLRMTLAWLGAVRWLHDAFMEDLLDRAATETGAPVTTKWSPWVRFLRLPVFQRRLRRTRSGSETVAELFRAVERRDLERVLACYHPAVVISEAATLPYGGEYVGHDGAIQHAFAYVSTWDGLQADEDRALDPTFIDGDGSVAVVWHQRARVDGNRLDIPAVSIYTVEDGKVRRARMFQDTAAVLEFLATASTDVGVAAGQAV